MLRNKGRCKPVNNLPKLKVSGLGWDETGKLIDFQHARYFPFSQDLIITVDGQVVDSFEEMVRLAERGIFLDKPCLEVVFLPVIVGG
jgi:hypothetical protein